MPKKNQKIAKKLVKPWVKNHKRLSSYYKKNTKTGLKKNILQTTKSNQNVLENYKKGQNTNITKQKTLKTTDKNYHNYFLGD